MALNDIIARLKYCGEQPKESNDDTVKEGNTTAPPEHADPLYRSYQPRPYGSYRVRVHGRTVDLTRLEDRHLQLILQSVKERIRHVSDDLKAAKVRGRNERTIHGIGKSLQELCKLKQSLVLLLSEKCRNFPLKEDGNGNSEESERTEAEEGT